MELPKSVDGKQNFSSEDTETHLEETGLEVETCQYKKGVRL